MELGSLRNPRNPQPVLPRLKSGDHRIHAILRDLDKIKGSKPKWKLKRCEQLIYFIAQSLRKGNEDHLLHTTTIWVLISIFRMFPRDVKPIMLQAGIPSALYDMIKCGSLSGSSRQYASELCFYLSSNFEHSGTDNGKPLQSYPEIQPFDRYQSTLDDISIASMSDMSSIGEEKPIRQPFVPYRIDDQNLAKMEALFSSGYEQEVAAALPNISLMSNFGFSQNMNNDDDDDEEELDDDHSMISNLSSGSYSVQKGFEKIHMAPNIRRSQTSYGHGRPLNDNDSLNSLGSSIVSGSSHGGSLQRPFTTPENHINYKSPSTPLATSSGQNSAPYGLWLGNRVADSTGVAQFSTTPHRVIHQLRNGSHQGFAQISTSTSTKIKQPDQHNMKQHTIRNELLHLSNTNNESPSSAFQTQNAEHESNIFDYMNSLDPFTTRPKLPSKLTKQFPITSATVASKEDVDDTSLASDVDEDADSDFDSDSDGSISRKQRLAATTEEINDDDIKAESNPFIKRQKMRIRAEKLIDHKFVKALFVKKMSLQETRNMIFRIENIIQLIDPQNTGYVTFEQFMKITLSVAPPHLLRADIVNFFQYQTDNLQNLLDYQEFIISGKVLLLSRAQHAHALKQKKALQSQARRGETNGTNELQQPSTMAWLKRQKEVMGEESTYTWKNHIKWYQQRQSAALIWLIRRAVRALDYEKILLAAQRFLLITRKQALALNDLLDYGRAAMVAQDKRQISKIHLLKRCIHARKYLIKQLNAFQYLKYTAVGAKKEIQFYENLQRLKESSGIPQDSTEFTSFEKLSDAEKQEINDQYNKKFYNKLQSVNYNKFYKIRAYQQKAINYLKEKAVFAEKHSLRQDEAYIYLNKTVHKVQIQLSRQSKVRYELALYGNRALEFCLKQDESILGLIRVGNKAFNLMIKQIQCLEWLQIKGTHSITFLTSQSSTAISLISIGKRNLAFLNQREDSYAYLAKRCSKAIVYMAKKREAETFLRNATKKVWKLLDDYIIAVDWLQARAKRAKQYIEIRKRAYQYLQFIAGKASATARKSYMIQQELIQIGIASKLVSFQVYCKSISNKRSRILKMLKEEKQRIRLHDKQMMKIKKQLLQSAQKEFLKESDSTKKSKDYIQQQSLEFEIKWMKLLIIEAFQIISSYYTPIHAFPKSPTQKLDNIMGDNETTAPADIGDSKQSETASSAVITNINSGITLDSLFATYAKIPHNIIGRYGLRKLLHNGKLIQSDTIAVDEIFRNHDYSSSCYIPMEMILPYIYKRLIKVKAFQKLNSLNDILTVDERAFIAVHQNCMKDHSLFEEEDKGSSSYDDYRKKMESKSAQKQQPVPTIVDSDDDFDEDEDEFANVDINDDAIFSDIETLKRMDVGKIMRYLTKRTHDQIAQSLVPNAQSPPDDGTTSIVQAEIVTADKKLL